MAASPLTRERILEAAEGLLRRHGPDKATVVDVARALGVSHGSVYRHFASKNALREAVTARWLARDHQLMADATAVAGPASGRLRSWLRTLFEAKRARASGDPELFATFLTLVDETSEVATAHVRLLVGQLAAIVADGIAVGEFAASTDSAAHAVWSATTRFHHPRHSAAWSLPGVEDEFEAVCDLVLRGLARRSEGSDPGASDRPLAPLALGGWERDVT